MDGSPSLPLPLPRPRPAHRPPLPPQVFLRCPAPPRGAVPAAPPHVHYFRAPSPIPVYSPRLPGPRYIAARPPTPPPPAPAAAAAAPSRPPQASPAQLPPPRPPQPVYENVVPPPRRRGRPKSKAPENEQKIEIENAQSEVGKGEISQGHHKESTTGPTKGIKRARKPHGSIEGDAANNCRYDSSLGLLTKKFINLLKGAEDGTLDLNKAVEILEVQKRRIYDITNVLEGVDLIEKGLKNTIRWKGFDMLLPKEVELQTSALKEELDSSHDEECRLDEEIREAQEKLLALKLNKDKKKWLYLSKEDICKIPHLQGSTRIAIHAPHGTCVEVPDPNADMDICKDLESQEKHYQLLLRSSMGPIDCFLISDHQGVSDPEQVAQDNLDHASTAGGSDAPRPVDDHPSQAPEKGEGDTVGKHTSEPSSTHELMSGILKIVLPDTDADADYWLASDVDATMTETWAT
ncbi:transcription factor E2FC-like [Triticum urartu]|uniref:transcription factor E2FC-like n=1 Tax=Triticum urartu TaxID=4572 RepID=UPI0020448D45|nr:transcription factor E2FC-like [Triticum urartu]